MDNSPRRTNNENNGTGSIKQAVEAVIEFAFNTLKLHRIEADTDTENAASLALLEKLGFKREGCSAKDGLSMTNGMTA